MKKLAKEKHFKTAFPPWKVSERAKVVEAQCEIAALPRTTFLLAAHRAAQVHPDWTAREVTLCMILADLAYHDRAAAMREKREGCVELQQAELILEEFGIKLFLRRG